MGARQTARSIAAVLQEQQSDFSLTVREIIALGRTPYTSGFGGQSKADTQIIDAVIERLKLTALTGRMLGTLSGGERQRTMIARALVQEPLLLILDEPTGVLTPAEADHLFRILKGLRDQGKTIILITHKLREIMETTDTVSVMRRGEMTATVKTAETSPAELAELMVGRKVLLRVDKKPAAPGPVILDVEGLRVVDDKGVERLRGICLLYTSDAADE